MGESHGAGDMIRLIFEEDGKWIALMTWAAACYRLKPRDLEIGWNRAMCAKCLKLIASNWRFTILNEKGARPNLASQLLGMAMRELPAIWKRKWGYSPLLAETFCDMKGFTKGAWETIVANDLPDECDVAAHSKAVGCARKRDALGNPIEGKYACPSYSTFHCVLQVKANQRSVARQCETISRIRPLVGTFKKRAEPGTLGSRPRRCRGTCSGTPRS